MEGWRAATSGPKMDLSKRGEEVYGLTEEGRPKRRTSGFVLCNVWLVATAMVMLLLPLPPLLSTQHRTSLILLSSALELKLEHNAPLSATTSATQGPHLPADATAEQWHPVRPGQHAAPTSRANDGGSEAASSDSLDEQELHIEGPQRREFGPGRESGATSVLRHTMGGKRTLPIEAGDELAADPFAFTFEDYLREAARAHSGGAESRADTHEHEFANSASAALGPAHLESSATSARHGGRPLLEIVSDEEEAPLGQPQSRGPGESAVSSSAAQVDYIFPPAATEAPTGSSQHSSKATTTTTTEATTLTATGSTSGKTMETSSPASSSSVELGNNSGHSQDREQEKRAAVKELAKEAAKEEQSGEIGLLFAWRSLPTNKCSRECGRGFRLNHLSCIDLKFNVRVEDQLCESGELAKPEVVNRDEPCNELDCAPHWSSIEMTSCGGGGEQLAVGRQPNGSGAACLASVFKRVECVQLNAQGHTVPVDESLCSKEPEDQDGTNEATSGPPSTPSTLSSASGATSGPEDASNLVGGSFELSEFSLLPAATAAAEGELADRNERNEILPERRHHSTANRWPLGSAATGTGGGSASHEHYYRYQSAGETPAEVGASGEPFWEAGVWSECAGAACGQLGVRRRTLTCRLFLARSAKLVALPDSSCHSAHRPHTEEPCYMDCGVSGALAGEQTTSGGNGTDSSRESERRKEEEEQGAQEEENELVYEAQRFAWRLSGWTKCSAECLGGRSESVLECWDKVAERVEPASTCERRLLDKPRPQVRSCNEVACAPEWRLEPFGNCSRSCGSAGVRTRSVACVQLVPLQPGHSSYMLVSNDLCIESTGDMPHTLEPCNRLDCAPEWSVGPWGECEPLHGASGGAGGVSSGSFSGASSGAECAQQLGRRNRTVICVQEFSSREGPTLWASSGRLGQLAEHRQRRLQEALLHSARHWHPGKASQVPAEECVLQYGSQPAVSEPCRLLGGGQCAAATNEAAMETTQSPAGAHSQRQFRFIDADPAQDFRLEASSAGQRRRTVTLKVGGRAQLPEGRNLKIRCRVMAAWRRQEGEQAAGQPAASLGPKRLVNVKVHWFKDGVRIFAPNLTHRAPVERVVMAAGDNLEEEVDNSILVGGDLLAGQRSSPLHLGAGHHHQSDGLMAADQPSEMRNPRAEVLSSELKRSPVSKRKLRVRSSLPGVQFAFVPQLDGRFSLVKDNTLRIKRLRQDDSGLYTCVASELGPDREQQLSETLELSVFAKEHPNKQHSPATSGAESNNY